MKAIQSDVKTLLEGAKQFVLPLYQRRYSWSEKHWHTLADDLDRLMEEPDRQSHFIGSFVTAPLAAAADQNVSRFRLIDGQQRLTTLLLLLAALRDVAAERGEAELSHDIHDSYLVNPRKKGDLGRKLIATETDRPALDATLNWPAIPSERVGMAYTFFADRFRAMPDEFLALARQVTVNRLAVVSITLEGNDDPHMILESLNAKGERLTQADLLRNYFIMRLPPADADAEFARLWQPMERDLGDDLTNFFRHFLMRAATGADVRRDEIYFHVKERVGQEAATPRDVVGMLEEVRRFATYYARLIRPGEFEADREAAVKVVRLHQLKVTTAYPFLMNVMEAVADDRLAANTYRQTLDLIEQFVVRRMTCGVPTNQLRQIFAGLCPVADEATDTAGFLAAVADALSQGMRCPTDAAFQDAIARRVLYGGRTRDVARYLLNRIEASLRQKEAVDPTGDGIQVEHVMPQTLTDAWWAELSPDDLSAAESIHAQWVHTLGNLTLTGFNPTLGNRPFAEKRAVYAESNFSLNRYFAGVNRWDAAAILARGEWLAKLATGIWPDLSRDRTPSGRSKRLRVKPPVLTAVIVSGQRFATTSMIDATQRVFEQLSNQHAGAFAKALAKAMPPRRRGPTPDGMRAPKPLGNGVFIDLHNSGRALRKRCDKLVAALKLPSSTVTFELADG